MKEPFANLDTANIDEQIEQILHTMPTQQDKEEASYLRDLHYLYRKEEILARAQQRLMIAGIPQQDHMREDQPTDPGMLVWRERSTLASRPYTRTTHRPFSWPKIAAVLAAAVLLIGALIGTASFLNARPQQAPAGKGNHTSATATPAMNPATVTAIVTNTVFSDPLSQNIYNWPVSTSGSRRYFFKDGAYHIANQSLDSAAVVIQQHFTEPALAYQLTMQEVKGDDTSPTNTFGLILRYSTSTVRGVEVEKFYTFQILNENGASQYSFSSYNSGKSNNPWKTIWKANTGKEFHSGHEPAASNTVKVFANGASFTFYVNGLQVGTARDGSLQSGSVGMLVNLKGTEVAFSNLLITRF